LVFGKDPLGGCVLFHRFQRPIVLGIGIFGILLILNSLGVRPDPALANDRQMDAQCMHTIGDDCDRGQSALFHDFLFHLDGWESVEPADGWESPESEDGSSAPDAPDGAAEWVTHLKSARPYQGTRLTLGRQRILGGVTNNRVDGLKLSAGLGPRFSATAFGGRPSPLNKNKNNSGDLIYGARIATHPLSIYEIGLSYEKLMAYNEDKGENAGADFSLKLGSRMTVNGLSNFSVEGRGWREHNYSALLNAGSFQIKPSYRYYQLNNHFDQHSAENYIFGFIRKKEEVVNIAGTDMLWRGLRSLQVGLRGRSYDYDTLDEKALYYAGLLNFQTPRGSRIDLEAGRMEGETPNNVYSLFRCQFYWRSPLALKNSFFSIDALYLDYDEAISGTDGAVHASLNGGLFFPRHHLEIRLSGIYSQDPYFHDNVGGMISFSLRY
jgi:hypothetical protein